MRKLLLTSVALLGVMGTNAALAQTEDASDEGQAQGLKLAPGTVSVRLNGRVRIYGGYYGNGDGNREYYYDQASGAASYRPFNLSTVSPSNFSVNKAGQTVFTPTAAPLNTNKQANYGENSLVRLYPGFDGKAANGLRYGATVEIRTDNGSGAGGGVYGSPSQQTRQFGQLYLRRAYGYVATDKLGTIRIGGGDGPSGLFMVGNFENFNDGGWNGDVYSQIDSPLQPVWPFADVGSVYATNKVVYLSPQFEGFDFGVAYEPNTSTAGEVNGSNGCNGNSAIGTYIPGGPNVAGAGCDTLSSTSTGDYTRRRNTADVAVRYRGTFDDIGVAAYINYIGGGKVLDSSPGVGAFGQRARQYEGLSLGVAGAAITYAGFTVGGLVQSGQYNGSFGLKVQGQKDATAYLGGASYTIGPVIIGASYFEAQSAGASGPDATGKAQPLVGQRRERGVAYGGTYTVAPGLNLFLSGLWGERKENGFDFVLNQAATATNPARTPYVKSQLLTLGASFTW